MPIGADKTRSLTSCSDTLLTRLTMACVTMQGTALATRSVGVAFWRLSVIRMQRHVKLSYICCRHSLHLCADHPEAALWQSRRKSMRASLGACSPWHYRFLVSAIGCAASYQQDTRHVCQAILLLTALAAAMLMVSSPVEAKMHSGKAGNASEASQSGYDMTGTL